MKEINDVVEFKKPRLPEKFPGETTLKFNERMGIYTQKLKEYEMMKLVSTLNSDGKKLSKDNVDIAPIDLSGKRDDSHVVTNGLEVRPLSKTSEKVMPQTKAEIDAHRDRLLGLTKTPKSENPEIEKKFEVSIDDGMTDAELDKEFETPPAQAAPTFSLGDLFKGMKIKIGRIENLELSFS